MVVMALFKGKKVYEKEMDLLREQYKQWKLGKQEKKDPFFIIYNDFKDLYLKEISGGALKLYIFMGFHARNWTGELWISTPKFAEFFEKDPRTIKKWLAELEEIGLIKRIQTGYHRVANTFLLPY
jgi:hypothetical protein